MKNEDIRTPVALGTAPLGALLGQYAFPAIIAQIAASLYNMADAIFIGQGVGPLAISGLAITFPFMNMAAAFGTLVGVGGSTLCSILLGEKNYDMARRTLGNVVVLNAVIGVVFTVFALVFLDPILYFFGASEQTIPYAREYMVIILAANAVTHIYFGLNSLLRSSGHPREAMAVTLTAVLLNIVLDPIFIFRLGTGIKGAAIATVISQVVSLIWIICLFSRRNEVVHFEKRIFRLHRRLVKDSFSIGTAPFLMNFAACFVVILINKTLGKYGGDLSIGAYGVANRIVFVFTMVCMGLTQGMQPIAGYNFGARQMDRVTGVLRLTLLCGTAVMSAGCIIGWACPGPVCRLFTTDSTLIGYSATALRYMMAVAPTIAVGIIIGNFFQSIGKPKRAIFLSLSRQVIVLIPLMLLLSPKMGVYGVWLSFPLSDVIAAVIAAVLLVRFNASYAAAPESVYADCEASRTERADRLGRFYRRLAFFRRLRTGGQSREGR